MSDRTGAIFKKLSNLRSSSGHSSNLMEDKELVSRIKSLREQTGLTQRELSLIVGVTENTIANWESGRSGLDLIEKLIKLCRALNCSLDDLVEVRDARTKSN
ncbi:MAG: helix-turn-helix transcriptional regulator [Elainellaceae cyanobacterium]